jgi:mannosyl-3-phosphoglycerate phosphatase
MLAAVDRPILVQKPDGSHEDAIALSHLERAEGVGPVGWNRTVLRLLEEFPESP